MSKQETFISTLHEEIDTMAQAEIIQEEEIQNLQEGGSGGGLSAYQLAVANGYEGTVEEWLASLVGADGTNGQSAYQLAVTNGFVGTVEEWLASLVGADGTDGATGQSFIIAKQFVSVAELDADITKIDWVKLDDG